MSSSADAPDTALLSGWGRTAPTSARVRTVASPSEVEAALTDGGADGRRGAIPRGLGRAYNDAAQRAGGTVVDLTGLSGLRSVDVEAATFTAHAGTSFDDLIRWLVPLGLFVPVTPGTRQVTVGGAVAADVHGKNHHAAGTFGSHVRSLVLQPPSGPPRTLDPDGTPEEFWATVGGMGLTGAVLEATVAAHPIETNLLRIDTDRVADLDTVMALMEEGDAAYPYSVAWIDLMARGRSMGRSVLTRGDWARVDDLPPKRRSQPLTQGRQGVDRHVPAPPWAPSALLNRLTIGVFNEAWFRRAPAHREGELQSINTFFYPLDLVSGWNRLYGGRGFVQWQCVVPLGAEATLRRVVERLSAVRCPSFLSVLKRFGAANPGPLSFPMPGWTLTLDIPAGIGGLGDLLDAVDEEVVDAGGRLYLAKESRATAATVRAMYPRVQAFRDVRDRVDPDRRFNSDLARRLDL